MYKASIDLGRINPHLKITFNVVMKGDNISQANKYNTETVDKFRYNGSTYLRFSPRPYITLDISSTADKGETWNPNLSVNLNKMCLYEFNQRCESMLEGFQIKELFYTDNSKLKLSSDIAKEHVQKFRVGNKGIIMMYTVVTDEDNPEVEYEGVSIMINSIDNFALITYSEFKYLHHVLSSINMDMLAMQLINAYISIEKNKGSMNNTRELSLPKMVISEPNSSENDIKPLPEVKQSHEIPDI